MASKELAFRGDSPKQIDRRAEQTLSAKSTFGAALRTNAAEHSLMVVGAEAIGLGLLDRSETAAKVEAKLVAKTGLGWKGWAGAGFGILGGLAAWSASKAKSQSEAKADLEAASILMDLAVLPIGIELYNVAITGGQRVKAAVQSGRGGELEEVSGLPRRARRKGLRKGRQALRNLIDIEDEDSLQDLLGFSLDEVDTLLGRNEEEDEPQGLPIFNFTT